jgi:hypothetical protein
MRPRAPGPPPHLHLVIGPRGPAGMMSGSRRPGRQIQDRLPNCSQGRTSVQPDGFCPRSLVLTCEFRMKLRDRISRSPTGEGDSARVCNGLDMARYAIYLRWLCLDLSGGVRKTAPDGSRLGSQAIGVFPAEAAGLRLPSACASGKKLCDPTERGAGRHGHCATARVHGWAG